MEILKAYDAARKNESKPVPLRSSKFLFIGTPRSGKSSMRQRLMRKFVNLISFMESQGIKVGDGVEPTKSTGFTERCDVIIKQPTNQLVALSDKSEWLFMEGSDRSNETSQQDYVNRTELDYHDFCRHLLNAMKLRASHAKDRSSSGSSRRNSSSSSSSGSDADQGDQFDGEQDRSPQIAESDTSQDQRSRIETDKTHDSLNKESVDPEIEEVTRAIEKLEKTLQSSDLDKLYQLLVLINMMDVGGQPEFLDMLPSIVFGPTLYLLFFRLDQELSKRYPVEYVDANRKTIQLESEYSTEQVLYQCLATIDCFGHFPTPEQQVLHVIDEKALRKGALQPCDRLLLFGTFLDEANKNDIDICDLEKRLMADLRNNPLYKANILLRSHDQTFVTKVNNMSGTEVEMSEIRKHIEENVNEYFPKYELPPSWFLFHSVLQSLDKPVVTLNQCKMIMEHFPVKQDVEQILGFFHHFIGSLMYFPDLLSMKNTVICNPQIIFDCITNMIIKKFNRVGVLNVDADNFRRKGQFSKKQLMDNHAENNPLTVDQLVDILLKLNLLVEVGYSEASSCETTEQDQENNQEFIFPANLEYAPEKELTSSDTSLFIRFEVGFVPFGIFSTCIARLIAKSQGGQQDSKALQISLSDKDQVWKNKVKFIAGYPKGFVATLISRSRNLEIQVERQRPEGDHSLLEARCNVRMMVTNTLKNVIQDMQQNQLRRINDQFHLTCSCCVDKNDKGTNYCTKWFYQVSMYILASSPGPLLTL